MRGSMPLASRPSGSIGFLMLKRSSSSDANVETDDLRVMEGLSILGCGANLARGVVLPFDTMAWPDGVLLFGVRGR